MTWMIVLTIFLSLKIIQQARISIYLLYSSMQPQCVERDREGHESNCESFQGTCANLLGLISSDIK